MLFCYSYLDELREVGLLKAGVVNLTDAARRTVENLKRRGLEPPFEEVRAMCDLMIKSGTIEMV